MNEHRVAVGVAIVLALAALSARDFAGTLKTWRRWPPPGVTEDVVLYERNCAAVRDQLPLRGTVGFRDLTRGDDAGAGRRHALTQYSLAPLLVLQTAGHPTVVVVNGTNVGVAPAGGP